MKSWIGFRTLIWREIVRFFSVFNQTILPPVISSSLYIFIFGLSLGKHIQAIDGVPYLEFMLPGLIMMYIIEGAYANTSSSLFISRWANNIEEILVTPLSYLEMVSAILIGGLIRSFITATGVYLVSLLFAPIAIGDLLIALYFLIFVSLIFSSLGMMVALFAEEWEHLSIATTFIITPLVFFGGVFHSIQMVPGPLKVFTAFNPIFYMINGLRYSFIGVSDAPVGISMVVVFVVFAVLFSTTVYLFKIGFKLRK